MHAYHTDTLTRLRHQQADLLDDRFKCYVQAASLLDRLVVA